VFQTSLYSNPFSTKLPETEKLAFMKKDKPEASSEVSPEASPAGSANTSQVETTKMEMGSNKQF
jgi:hypothetical protein